MRRAAIIAVAAMLLPLSGCGDPEVGFHIDLSMQPAGKSMACDSPMCSAWGLSCGGWFSYRLIDPDSHEVLVDVCAQLPKNATLCSIDDLMLPPSEVRTGRLMVEIAIWSPDATDPTGHPGCPVGDFFDAQGLPSRDNRIAFGGRAYVVAGEEDAVPLVLGCKDPGLVNECTLTPATKILANVSQIETNSLVSNLASSGLSVGIGEPVEEADPLSHQSHWTLAQDTVTDLVVTHGDPPIWTGTRNGTFIDSACTQVISRVVPSDPSVPMISCVPVGVGDVSVTGFTMEDGTLEKILAAAGLPAVPAEGLIIGRVRDETNMPAAGVTVEPTVNIGSVRYLSAQLDSVAGLVTTSSSGYFISTDIPFKSTWTASDASGRKQSGSYRTGLVAGQITLLQIKVELPDIGGQQ